MARKHHKSTLARIKMIKELTLRHYESGNQSRCYKAVWRSFIYPRFRICYRTYLTYIGVSAAAEEPCRWYIPDLFGE